LVQIVIVSQNATPRQLALLERLGQTPDQPLSRAAASEQIEDCLLARWQLPPTPKEEWFLRSRGRWSEGLTRGQASDRIGEILAREGRGS
jgi:hypothetical protein